MPSDFQPEVFNILPALYLINLIYVHTDTKFKTFIVANVIVLKILLFLYFMAWYLALDH